MYPILTEFFSKRASETHESASFYVCILCPNRVFSKKGPLKYSVNIAFDCNTLLMLTPLGMKHLLLARGICGLTHLEQVFAQQDKAEDLVSQAEQLILSGDITVAGLDNLLRLMDGISQGKGISEKVSHI